LSGITAALTGVRSGIGIGLIVHVAHPTSEDVTEDGLSRKSRCSGAGLLLALARSQTNSSDRVVAGYDHYFEEDLLSLPSANEIVNDLIRSQAEQTWSPTQDELVEDLLRDRMFLLYPTGTSDSPSWEAWPVADPAGGAAKAELELLARAKEAFDIDDDFDTWDLVMENTLILTPSESGLTTRTGEHLMVQYQYPRVVLGKGLLTWAGFDYFMVIGAHIWLIVEPGPGSDRTEVRRGVRDQARHIGGCTISSAGLSDAPQPLRSNERPDQCRRFQQSGRLKPTMRPSRMARCPGCKSPRDLEIMIASKLAS
jgi:hypothetical protein